MTTIDLTSANPFSPEFQQCPHQYYRAMQEGDPVFHVPGTDLYLVTRHELVVPILRDTTTFSSRFMTGEMPKGPILEQLKEIVASGWPNVGTMLTIDPPYQTRYRNTVAPYFTPKRIGELRPAVESIVTRLIDNFVEHESFDLVPSFAIPLPIEAIAAVLNVPTERMADFKRWSDDSIATIGANPSDERRLEAQRGIVELQHYLAGELEARRAEPRGDLLTEVGQAQIDTDELDADGKPVRRLLEMAEMLSIVQQLLVAGNETTTKALTEGVRLLAENPHEWDALLADPAGRAAAITEEVLRLATPTQAMFRIVTKDTEIAGHPVPKGARLLVVYSAANRDPSVWGDDPDAFDPGRTNLKDHLAFGKGVHFCIGAPLSRLEMQVAFELLGRRLQSVTLDDDNDFEYHPSFMLRGLKRLRVTITKQAGAPA